MTQKELPLLLRSNLKALRLPTMLAEHGKLAGEAADSNQDYLDYPLRLTELELATRSANALQARIKLAGFPVHMQVPGKQSRSRRLSWGGSENSCVRRRAQRPNHVWTYDFITDRTEDGRQLKMLVVVDEFTRENLAIEVARWRGSRE